MAILLAVGLVFVIAFVGTGAWHVVLRPFCLDLREMTVSKLGFRVSDPQDVACVDGICRAFAGGFNAMISRASPTAWSQFSDRQPVFFRPFADEGAAVGYSLRSMGRFSPKRFEEKLVAKRPGFAYLHYVGLGFWHAKRDYRPSRLDRIVAKLDPLYGMLCWDGYGFKFGFFDFEQQPGYTERFARLAGYAANVAYQGLGRSLWFRFMDDPEQLVATLRSFESYATDAASGVGLASVFATLDRPDRGLAFVEQMPAEWHGDVLLGMSFGYKARFLCDAGYFDRAIAEFDAPRRDAIGAGLRQCDTIEAEVRRDGGSGGYRRWRAELTEWLKENVEYPFAGMKHPLPVAADRFAASV